MKHYSTTIFSSILLLYLLPQPVNGQPVKPRLLWQATASVRTIRFSHDGNLLVTGGALGNCYPYQCGQIKLWRVSDSALLNTITQPWMGLTDDVDINSNSKTIISGNGSVYCAADGGCSSDKPGQFKFTINGALKKSLNNPGGNVYAIEYSPDETVIAAGTGYNFTGEIRIYDTSFNLLRTLAGHQYETDGLAFTPDGQYLISGGDDGRLIFWNYRTGNSVRSLFHGDYFNGGTNIDVDASPDGQYVSSAGQGYNMTVKIWRVSDGHLVHTLTVPGSDGYNTARFSPDSKYIVSGTTQYGSNGLGWYGQILVWRVSDGALVKTIIEKEGSPLSGGIRTIAFSETNSLFAYSVSDKLKVLDISGSGSPGTTAEALSNNTELKTTAFPNPFSSVTNIEYAVSKKQFVKLAVYNFYGKEMAVLVNEQKEAGSYHVSFNASKLNPGIYFYRLTSGDNTVVQKLILNK
jgi:WD40 repeat protein